MPSRSRHAPLPAANNTYSGYGNTVQRHPAMPRSDVYFSSASLDPDMLNSNFSLLSSTAGSRHYVSSWNSGSDSVPGVDDYLPVSGYDSVSLSGTCFPMSMMSATSDAVDVTYGLTAGEPLSRHAPLDTSSQTSGLTASDLMIDDYSFVDLNAGNPLMDGTYLTVFGPQSDTPPPEEELQKYFDDQGSPGRHDRFGNMHQDASVCENLGVSKLQAYSASRHNTVQPRAIRPSSERTDTQSTGSDSLDSHSPKEDHLDKVKARNDPKYDAKPDKDGLYHCPFTKGADKCNHSPTKQKCIYSKYLDSHLRPYKCKFAAPNSDCEEARFSSNACLFRHERETHGMHNHGHNPYVCLFQDCERAKQGNGFPRRWNQRDHMKRVHGWEGDDSSPDRSSEGVKRRRGAPASVPMRRSGTPNYARAQQTAVAYPKDHRRPSRHQPQVSYAAPLQACNVAAYPSMNAVQYSQPQYLTQSRHGQPYVASYPYGTVY